MSYPVDDGHAAVGAAVDVAVDVAASRPPAVGTARVATRQVNWGWGLMPAAAAAAAAAKPGSCSWCGCW